jgi:hypothetical protein
MEYGLPLRIPLLVESVLAILDAGTLQKKEPPEIRRLFFVLLGRP